ncbi:Maf-like protein [Aphelenchoides fujianensis]|nr:Maf-like protein [Aphelenchoides fujianensis]
MSTWDLDIPTGSGRPAGRRGIEPEVEASGYDEDIDKSVGAEEFVRQCGRTKAKIVADRWKQAGKHFDFVIGTDTILNVDGEIIGKAADEADAVRILKKLSGRGHEVLSGVTIVNGSGKEATFVSRTTVEFAEIDDRLLSNYLQTGEHKGCAGAYRIQGKAAVFVRGIVGDYHNVVGLPLHELVREMRQLGAK